MKIKTSVTLSAELLATIDPIIKANQNRSLFLEKAAWEYIARAKRKQQDQHDLALIDQHSEQLNSDALDTLAYQVAL